MLIAHCRQSLARLKVPRAVFVEHALPKNAVGKIAGVTGARQCAPSVHKEIFGVSAFK